MGDLPEIRGQMETDLIFQPILNEEVLIDEVYCQIMKQLTENTMPASEERGWDLMWLITGLIAPSNSLIKELQEFLKTRPHLIAKESLNRLQKTLKYGNRQYPPYIVEVDSIKTRSMHIFHKIYFPDDTDEAYEIESCTKVRDLMNTIVSNFDLKSKEGFSLFIKIGDKVFSLPENYHIFDFINEINDWMNVNLPSRGGEKFVCQYQLFFLKKLWLNCVPGKDKNADEIFYFYQEIPKYSNGYYKVMLSNLYL